MRDYGVVSPKFWIGATGKSLRGDADAQILALYLMTGPHAISTGVYHCPKVYMAHEAGLPMEGACKALQRLIEAKFCEYDEASEWVFVYQMARFQIGEAVSPKDRRHKWLLNEVSDMPNSLMRKFILTYGGAYAIPPYDEPPSPIQAPSKPLRSQDHDQDQEHGQEQDHGHGQDARDPEKVSRGTFDGWSFIDQRLRPAYPRGTYRANAWITASRDVERLIEQGVEPDELVANATAYQRQQEAEGNEGTKFILSPVNWLAEDNWRGPFPISASKAQVSQDANIAASQAWLNRTANA
jgi:hypothetical protein